MKNSSFKCFELLGGGQKHGAENRTGANLGSIALSIREKLVKGETIKIISHSMGAATAEGIIETLHSLRLPIEKVINLGSSNAKGIRFHPVTSGIEHIQINATGVRVIEHLVDPFSNETEQESVDTLR